MSSPKKILVLLLGLALLTAAVSSAAEEGSLRFQKTVPYKLGKLVELNAKVGPVRVDSIEFSQPKDGGGPAASIVGRIRGGGGSSETQATIRAAFDTQNPNEDEWVVTYTLDFLDRDGKLIDRVTKSEGFEGEAKVYNLDHQILEYVLPMIHRVEIRLEARYD
ncbi:MAG TPA: hypothetical protein VMW27_19530 [Thermoanaerobaculia bacterium]|nr:hypothetical protein [Thermoanaerobaculia bacterium]